MISVFYISTRDHVVHPYNIFANIEPSVIVKWYWYYMWYYMIWHGTQAAFRFELEFEDFTAVAVQRDSVISIAG